MRRADPGVMSQPPPGPVRPPPVTRSWTLWQASPAVRGTVLVVDALALAVLVAVTLDGIAGPAGIGRRDLVLAAALAGGALLHIEVARHVERLRFLGAVDRYPYVDLKSVWTFAGLLLLPLPLALALVVLTFGFTWLRTAHVPHPHRWVFSGATVALATVAAGGTLHVVGGPAPLTSGAAGALGVGAAALVRWTVNHGLVSVVVSLSNPAARFRVVLCRPSSNLLGLGGLALGVLLAVLVVTAPWFVPAVLLPLTIVHRGLFMDQLVRAAHVDAKTGLATPRFWHAEAARVLERAGRRGTSAGLLMIDLDEFKDVNDRWGHLVGDRVLRAVAEMLVDEFAGDLVARFGGEEFVVLVVGTGPGALAGAAEAVRRRTTLLSVPVDDAAVTGLSMSVGTAVYPGSGHTLDELILRADGALYAAKRAGRNRVRAA